MHKIPNIITWLRHISLRTCVRHHQCATNAYRPTTEIAHITVDSHVAKLVRKSEWIRIRMAGVYREQERATRIYAVGAGLEQHDWKQMDMQRRNAITLYVTRNAYCYREVIRNSVRKKLFRIVQIASTLTQCSWNYQCFVTNSEQASDLKKETEPKIWVINVKY